MKLKTLGLAAVTAALILAQPAWADRGGYRGSGSAHGNYAYGHIHGGHHFWGPFGFILGATLLYSALQPRTVYYEPKVVYAPPVYYVPSAPVVQGYVVPGDQPAGSTYATPQTSGLPPPPPQAALSVNAQPGPGASGAYWWYACKNPAGYYPYVRECPSGWEKIPPAPGDAPRD